MKEIGLLSVDFFRSRCKSDIFTKINQAGDIGMPKVGKEITVLNPQGLHARPAALFVQIASKYDSTVTLTKDHESVNGKSIMGILMLGIQQHTPIYLEVEGPDAGAAITELEEFLGKNE